MTDATEESPPAPAGAAPSRGKVDMIVAHECWTVKNDSNDAKRVDSCPAVAVPCVE